AATQADPLTPTLAYADARGGPLTNAPHSGYQRLEAAGTLILMDSGRAPPMGVSQEAHAGCLSFELSTRLNRIVVNCGLPLIGRDSWRQVARATAAHSTATLLHPHAQRHLVVPLHRVGPGAPPALRHADDRRAAPDHGRARGAAERRHAAHLP